MQGCCGSAVCDAQQPHVALWPPCRSVTVYCSMARCCPVAPYLLPVFSRGAGPCAPRPPLPSRPSTAVHRSVHLEVLHCARAWHCMLHSIPKPLWCAPHVHGRFPQAATSKPDGGAEEVEWEDVEEVGPGSRPGEAGGAGGAERAGPGGADHWRARAAVRQRFWSTSHGFAMGRKLGDWERHTGGCATRCGWLGAGRGSV